ncbi:hypothetical protein JHJ32_10395 [Parapedobacter sp. ISTM3]|uniref:hypothetical protein n=1 Tax=Parapedobacter sp. ISTM3 TaxID=2800130 RepID=UPI001903C391|nr:hypothetical protein [Parapedobacter sp. ISTM3]MBK1440395.1 hypothetical protein [Parapedobacter sp. ISTM3]
MGSSVLKFFSFFLLFQFLYQLAAALYSFVFTQHEPNYFIFNLTMPVNIAYFSALFYDIVKHPAKRKFIVSTTVINLLFYVINLAFIQGLFALMTYSRTALAVSLVIYSLLYFHEMLTSSAAENEVNPTRSATFWIVTAIFFFYLCSTLTIIIWDYLVASNPIIGPLMTRIFGFLLYAMYVVGMMLHKAEHKEPTA